ncbi:MAG: hypothetical protein D4S01_10205 [Dehalococcoidia bacterium]|nr:MAG: hypothetical protein D4S01_10205 [Dehalococcoidia bacterium]
MLLWEDSLMVRRKRRSEFWHHRVPDFKLVYCGPNYRNPKNESKFTFRDKRLKLSIIADEEDLAGSRLKQQKRLVQ